MAGIVLNIGYSNRVSERHIVGAVTEQAGISSHDLGRIQISETFSSVTVPAEAVDDVIAAMRGCKICGKPVLAMPMPAAERTAHKKTKPGVRGAAAPYHGGNRKDRNGPKRGKPSGHRQ